MAQLAAFLASAIFIAAAIWYVLYVVQRFGGYGGPKPHGWRLAVIWIAALLAVVAFLGLFLLAGHAVGVIYCSPHFSPTDPWPCNVAGRLSFLVGSILIFPPLLGLWLRFVNRQLNATGTP